MSAVGHQLPRRSLISMSALAPIADMRHGRPGSLEFPQRLTPHREVKQQRQGFTGILKVAC